MREEIARLFADESIEYYAALDYSLLYEQKPHIIKKTGITPRSCIVFLIPYFTGVPENFSAYAASRDYHIFVSAVTSRLIEGLSELYPEGSFVGFGDHSPINERGAAAAAGLGILGDSGMLINEKYGTYIFIAEIVSDLEPSLIGAVPVRVPEQCSHCGSCAAACPTGILSGSSDSCLSAITQKKGDLSEEEIALMRKYNTVWGCDICQSVCPYNSSVPETPIAFFHEEKIDRLTPDILSAMSDEEFASRAFSWRGRATVERNLEYLGR